MWLWKNSEIWNYDNKDDGDDDDMMTKTDNKDNDDDNDNHTCNNNNHNNNNNKKIGSADTYILFLWKNKVTTLSLATCQAYSFKHYYCVYMSTDLCFVKCFYNLTQS